MQNGSYGHTLQTMPLALPHRRATMPKQLVYLIPLFNYYCYYH